MFYFYTAWGELFFNPFVCFQGFESRGTLIGRRIRTTQNLIANIKPAGILVGDPKDFLEQKRFKKLFRKKLRKSSVEKRDTKGEEFGLVRKFANVTYDHSFAYGKPTTSIDTEDKFEDTFEEQKKLESLTHVNSSPNKFFCDVPREGFTRFVVERFGPNATDSLFDINAFHAICQLDETIQSVSYYRGFCERVYSGEECCRSWSIPNYISLLSNKSSCFDITEEDVDVFHRLLLKCFPYFRKESNDCAFTYDDNRCLNDAPKECLRENAIYGILEFLTDNGFQVSFIFRDF